MWSSSHLESNTGSVYMGGEHSGCSPGLFRGMGRPPFLLCPEAPSVGKDKHISHFFLQFCLFTLIFFSDWVTKLEDSSVLSCGMLATDKTNTHWAVNVSHFQFYVNVSKAYWFGIMQHRQGPADCSCVEAICCQRLVRNAGDSVIPLSHPDLRSYFLLALSLWRWLIAK